MRIVMVGMLALLVSAAVSAQSPASPATNSTPAIVVPRELALEEQVQLLTDQRNYYMNQVDELGLRVQQQEAVLVEMLAQMRAGRTKQADTTREAVGRKLVTLLGGDWEKGDRWNWQKRGLQKADGSFIALPGDAPAPVETRKPGGPQ